MAHPVPGKVWVQVQHRDDIASDWIEVDELLVTAEAAPSGVSATAAAAVLAAHFDGLVKRLRFIYGGRMERDVIDAAEELFTQTVPVLAAALATPGDEFRDEWGCVPPRHSSPLAFEDGGWNA